MSVLGRMYQLQLVDSERSANAERLAEIVQRLGPSPDVLQAQQATDAVEAGLHQARVRLRALELDAGSVRTKLQANQDRLYGGKVHNPKELSGLEEEAKALRRRQSQLEDEQLELLIAIEEQEAELADSRARLRQMEATWHSDQAELQVEKDGITLRLAELEAQRAGMRDEIGRDALTLYDELRRDLGGVAVVLLRHGMCQGCGVDVPTGLAQAVGRGEPDQYCPVCGRLLVGG